MAIRCRARMTSGRLKIALHSVPATNPICTARVSHDVHRGSSCHSAAICGATADTPNQSPIASNSAAARSARARRRAALSVMIRGMVARLLILLSLIGCYAPPTVSQPDRNRTPAAVVGPSSAAWLERETREQEERPEIVIAAMKLENGDVVADVGAGTG